MPADHAGEAAALRRARHVDQLADRERLHADGVAGLELREIVGGDVELPQQFPGLHARFREVPGHRLADARRAALAERDLHRGIAVVVRRLDLRHAVARDVEHGDRDRAAVVGEDAGHADLATYQS